MLLRNLSSKDGFSLKALVIDGVMRMAETDGSSGSLNLEISVGHGICGKSGCGRKMLLHFRHSTHPCVLKTNNHSQIMALVLIKSDSAGFFVQISSQNHEAVLAHQSGD